MARTTTATLPTGTKVRTASQSAMVLFADYGEHGTHIINRSGYRDRLERKAQFVRGQRRAAGLTGGRFFLVYTDGTGRVEEV